MNEVKVSKKCEKIMYLADCIEGFPNDTHFHPAKNVFWELSTYNHCNLEVRIDNPLSLEPLAMAPIAKP
jgi:hypothetical protein